MRPAPRGGLAQRGESLRKDGSSRAKRTTDGSYEAITIEIFSGEAYMSRVHSRMLNVRLIQDMRGLPASGPLRGTAGQEQVRKNRS